MGCNERRGVVLPWTYLAAKSSGGTFLPITAWFELGDYDQARSLGEMRGKSTGGTFTATLCIQYANDVRSPAGTTQVGNSVSADGMLDPTTATSLTTATGYRFARAGWWLVGDGSTPCFAMVGGTVILSKA